jgi:hypothetical protein
LVLQALRLIRIVLRFGAAVILMISAISSWFLRKKVKKGRLNKPLFPGDTKLGLTNPDNDGILLVGLHQTTRYKKFTE